MSDKAAKKKQYILDTAKNIFCEKGFKDVTMKDIVEACDISRGGLYIYFDSTETIFEEILKQEASASAIVPVKGDASTVEALVMFMAEQKKAILNSDRDLSVALYEYMFFKYSAGVPCESEKGKFESKVKALSALIAEGAKCDELYAEDSEETAKNILYVIEGLKLISKTLGITGEEIDSQLSYVLAGIIVDE